MTRKTIAEVVKANGQKGIEVQWETGGFMTPKRMISGTTTGLVLSGEYLCEAAEGNLYHEVVTGEGRYWVNLNAEDLDFDSYEHSAYTPELLDDSEKDLRSFRV